MAHHLLPACFDAECGPDLPEVALRCGLSEADVVRMLCDAALTVGRLGFLPGFPYLDGVPSAMQLPRRSTPRPVVAAGSVAIANAQAGIYPTASPGGWHLLARTSTTLFDPWRASPALLAADDTVELRAVARAEHEAAVAARGAPPSIPRGARTAQIVRAGPLTTVEDSGRRGFEHLGVAAGGASDLAAMELANALVGNAVDAAVLECALHGPTLRCDAPMLLAVTGAEVELQIDNQPAHCHRAIAVPAGAEVRIGRCVRGARVIVAIDGGIAVPLVLGSRSTHRRSAFGGFLGRALAAGDEVPLHAATDRAARWAAQYSVHRRALSRELLAAALVGAGPALLRFVPGPAWEGLTDLVKLQLSRDGHAASLAVASDRMGARLDTPLVGTLPDETAGTHASAPVQRGTIQLPPDGRPIVLGADHQATGGYPVLGQLINADHSTLAQLRPGDAVRLLAIEAAAAARLDAVHARHHAMALAALHLHG